MRRRVERGRHLLIIGSLVFLFLFDHSRLAAKSNSNEEELKISIDREYEHAEAKVRMDAQLNSHLLQKDQSGPKDILTIETLVNLLKAKNFSIRKNAELVYRARKQIGLEVGYLLPSLNFISAGAILTNNYIGIAATMVGFLYPSNWFTWRESRHLYEAERWTYMTLVANQVIGLLDLVFQINKMQAIKLMYEQYRERLETLLDQAIRRMNLSEDRLDQKIKIENVYLLLTADQQALEASIRKMHYQLAFVVNLPFHEWNSFEVAESERGKLKTAKKLLAHNFLRDVHENSLELEQLRKVFHARKYTGKSIRYNFFKPTAGKEDALGFGYGSLLKQGLSWYRQLILIREETAFKLDVSIFQAIEDHNLSIENYRRVAVGLQNGRDWYDLLETQFFLGGEYEAQEFLDALISILKFHTAMINLQFQYLGSVAMQDRLLLRGDFYKNLDEYIPERPQRCLGIRQLAKDMISWTRPHRR